jgi:transcriptional regulator with XRE-family HTH domain
MESNAFGLRLKELRNAAGLTQVGLSEKSGLGKSTITDLEQGLYMPTWPTVLSLAAALGVTCEAFNQPAAADAAPSGRGRPAKPTDSKADVDTAEKGRLTPGTEKKRKGKKK